MASIAGYEWKSGELRSLQMMKKMKTRLLASLLLMAPLLATALEFDEVREFGDVFKLSAKANSRDYIEVSWEIAEDYYLYNNKEAG